MGYKLCLGLLNVFDRKHRASFHQNLSKRCYIRYGGADGCLSNNQNRTEKVGSVRSRAKLRNGKLLVIDSRTGSACLQVELTFSPCASTQTRGMNPHWTEMYFYTPKVTGRSFYQVFFFFREKHQFLNYYCP